MASPTATLRVSAALPAAANRVADQSVSGLSGCERSTANASSYGDLPGSTAVFAQPGWINGVVAVPQPGSHALMGPGLLVVGGAARRRRAAWRPRRGLAGCGVKGQAAEGQAG